MKDFQTHATRLSATQRSAIRSHAMKHCRKLALDADVQDLEWPELASLQADAKRAARDVAQDVTDNTPEAVAAAMEAAHDALMVLIYLISV